MQQNDSLTPDDVAKSLKVSKLTVYDLIKKGELPSFRVGRQIRINRNAFEQYKSQGNSQIGASPVIEAGNNRPIIISGQDSCLDVLAKQIEDSDNDFRGLRSYTGSLDSLIAMYQGKGDIVSTHLFDGDTNTYNIPYIRKILVSKSFIVIHLLKREAGLFVPKNNPKRILSWEDLHKTNITMINRESGAGARVLLDEQLRLHNIDTSTLNGYTNEVTSHMDVASAISNGQADVGVGTLFAAKMANIDFVPLIEECYDLVLLKSQENEELIRVVQQIIQDNDFQNTLKSLGYNTTESGSIRYEQ